MKKRMIIVWTISVLLLLVVTALFVFAPIPGVHAQGPITPQNWHEYIADGARIVAQGQYSTLFDYVRAFGPAASGYSYKAASGWGFAVGFDPVQVQSQVRAVAQIPIQVKQSAPPDFTPGWSAYTGAAYWMARHGTLPPPSISTWFSSAIPMFSGLTTTRWTWEQWWLRTTNGAYGTWQW